MKKGYTILFSAIVIAMLILPTTVNTSIAQAISSTGPTAIPGTLIPPLDPNILPISPIIPNLGTVSIAVPISVYSITQIKSGQDASDPLTNVQTQQQLMANSQYWIYGGDAPVFNAPYAFFQDSQGLHIDVQAPSDGMWTGYYAVTPNTNAVLYHAVITTPVRTISTPNDFYENGLYVQTSQPFINYVACFSSTSVAGTSWAVGAVTGNATDGTQFNVLWADTSLNQPLTRDCTIITNGNNYLKVYLDGVMVYSSNALNLQMPAPFNAYLEPQSSYAGQMLDGIYKDYYSATGETVKVTHNPLLAATVKLVDPNGTVLASRPVDSTHTATLNVGAFHFPLVAYIKIYDSLGNQLASTSSPVNIFGGDVYNVKSNISLGPIGLP